MMTAKRWGIIAAVLGVLAIGAGNASAALPVYTGLNFPAIHGSSDPEEFSWEVNCNRDRSSGRSTSIR